jgi:hypothetical protein
VRALVRRIALAVSGLTLLVVALAAIVAPRVVAAHYGVSLEHKESYSEFRTVFVGCWLGQAALMLVAARRKDLPLLGDLSATLILCQAGGRALSFALDGTLEARFFVAFLAELTAGAIILACRTPPEKSL